MKSKQETDLVVCGGGVIGLSIAYQFAKHGKRVVLIERSKIGAGSSSWAGAGILPASANAMPEDAVEQLRFLSNRILPNWSHELYERTGIDNEYTNCGGLHLAASRAELATLRAQRLWWDAIHIPYEAWGVGEIRSRLRLLELGGDDLLGSDLRGNDCGALVGYFLPGESQLRNPRHLQALVSANLKMGVQIFENQEVLEWEGQAGEIHSVRTQSDSFIARNFCISNGAWALNMVAQVSEAIGGIGLADRLPGVFPVRGQMLLYETEVLEPPSLRCVFNEGHRYIVPRKDGRWLVGSCEEEVGFDDSTTHGMRDQLRQWAERWFPHLANVEPKMQWSGLRPGSFDGLPLIGRLDPLENLWIASGHFRHGLHWSAATAVLLHEIMEGMVPSIPMEPFSPLRGKTAFSSWQR